MSLPAAIVGLTGTQAEVNASNELKIKLSTIDGGAVRNFAEVDPGVVTGAALLRSAKVDLDKRLRVGVDALLDTETFNYAAQNTGKFIHQATTFVPSWTTTGHRTNPTGGVAAGSGATGGSRAQFPVFGSSTLRCEVVASFSAAMGTQTAIYWGMFQQGAPAAYLPADGAYFRYTSAGLYGCVNANGVETETGPFKVSFGGANWSHTIAKKYEFAITVHERLIEFWVDDVLMGTLACPSAQGQPFFSSTLPVGWAHNIVGGAASVALSFDISNYAVAARGLNYSRTLGEVGNAALGSYQGLSGGTMGSLANYANNANPTAAVPTNTTAALGTGLGGQFWETDTLAVTIDGIICSYAVPAGSAALQGRRLKVLGVTIDSFIQTALGAGGYVAQWSLAFGHTLVSLATAEAAAAKAPRRVPLECRPWQRWLPPDLFCPESRKTSSTPRSTSIPESSSPW